MNSLYNLALRQSSALQSDIAGIAPPASAAQLGQLAAALAALARTVDEYEAMARRELVPAKRDKALGRVDKFREEERGFRGEMGRLKEPPAQGSTSSTSYASSSASTLRSPLSPASTMQMRQSTIGGTPSYSNTPYGGSPYDSPHATPPPPSHADPLAAYRASAQAAYAAGGSARQDAALREHSFIGTAEAQLDALIAQGRATWGNLGEQREMLKGTQRRLRDAGVTMGLSRNVISYIERRSTQDNIIFVVGAIFTLVCFFYIYKWFG